MDGEPGFRAFGRDWGFRLQDVAVPVRWWHGEIELFVPLDAARAAAAHLPDAELVVLHGETHLAGFAATDDIRAYMHSFL